MNIRRLKFALPVFLGFFLSGLIGAGAQTACFNAPLAGIWINRDAAIQDLVKVEIIYQCTQEENENGLIIPGARWYVRAWAKCYPANCIWGRIRARIDPEGKLQASLPTFSADRFLQIKKDGKGINVHLIVDYHDPRRRDLDENVRLIKQGK